jgi:hypothetical protein
MGLTGWKSVDTRRGGHRCGCQWRTSATGVAHGDWLRRAGSFRCNAGRGGHLSLASSSKRKAWPGQPQGIGVAVEVQRWHTVVEADRATRATCTKGCTSWDGPCPCVGYLGGVDALCR